MIRMMHGILHANVRLSAHLLSMTLANRQQGQSTLWHSTCSERPQAFAKSQN